MIGFYFTGGGKMQLPVNPEKITIKRQSNNQRTEVVLLNEINILRGPKLASISFDFLLPGDDYYPFITGPWQKPETIEDYFKSLIDSGTSVRFTATEIGINQRVSVEDFSTTRIAGDHESLMASISLLEYRSYGAKVLQAPKTATILPKVQNATVRPADKPKASTYVVKPNDSFWRIAQQQLGNGSRYNEVAAANGMSAASVIHPGDVLKLPTK